MVNRLFSGLQLHENRVFANVREAGRRESGKALMVRFMVGWPAENIDRRASLERFLWESASKVARQGSV
jgi:hypothetical protein